MAYRRIDDNDTVEIRRAQGGNKPETRTVAESNWKSITFNNE